VHDMPAEESLLLINQFLHADGARRGLPCAVSGCCGLHAGCLRLWQRLRPARHWARGRRVGENRFRAAARRWLQQRLGAARRCGLTV
jgi:hypothetical protein